MEEILLKNTPITRDAIIQAGWSTTRIFDISAIAEELQREGYTISPAVQSFLLSFGGLHIFTPTHLSRLDGVTIDIHIDPIQAIQGTDPDWIRDYATITQSPLCPIGTVDHGHEILMMAPDGKVYGAFDELLMLYGTIAIEAFEHIFTRTNIYILRDAHGATVNEWYNKTK